MSRRTLSHPLPPERGLRRESSGALPTPAPPSAAVAVSGRVALGIVVAVWLVILALIARHRVFLSHDTMINYAHVWFASTRLWHGHGFPLHMPALGHGQAFTFPYGVVPWATAAVVRPLFGDWVVTLWLILGAVGVVAATFFAFPELRRGWWAAAVLVNPALVSGPLIGQLPFLWAGALFIAAIGCWRRERRVAAIVLAALAQLTHPAVLIPIAATLVALALIWVRNRRQLITAYVISVLPALPAAWIVERSPVFVESSSATKLREFIDTLAPRCLLVFVPIALVFLARRAAASVAPAAFAALIAANLAMSAPMGMPFAWRALDRWPNNGMLPFLASSRFTPAATYRVLRASDAKLGLYQLIHHGGHLDSEFFPESMAIESFPSRRAYSDLLVARHVDDVMAWDVYDRQWGTNEHALLEALAHTPPRQACAKHLVIVRRVLHNDRYDLYSVDRSCARHAAT